MEITTAQQKKEMKSIEDSLRNLWDNIKCTNIQIIGVPEEEVKKKGSEKIFEGTIVENFPNTGKEIVNQVQEAQRVAYRINPRRRSEEHTSELQSHSDLVCRLLLEKKNVLRKYLKRL